MSPLLRRLLALAALAAVFLISPSLNRPSTAEIAGHASVIDGDTIEIGGRRIRFDGIDAPESQQICTDTSGKAYLCGGRAAAALDEMVRGRTVRCEEKGQDRYGRTLGRCYAGTLDLQRELVRAGWAFAFRRYSTRYIVDEDSARTAARGIWQGSVVSPWDWRHCRREGNTAAQCSFIAAAPGAASEVQ